MKVQERRGFENDCRSLNVVWGQRAEAEQYPVNGSQIGSTLPRPINDRESLFYGKAVGNDRLGLVLGLGPARSKQFGDCCQQVCKHQQQVIDGRVE